MLEYEVRCVKCKTKAWKLPPVDKFDVPVCAHCTRLMVSTGEVREKARVALSRRDEGEPNGPR